MSKDWIEINSEANFGEQGNYTTQIYVGATETGDAPEGIKQIDGDGYINYDICKKVESNITGLDMYTCRLGDYDYLIHEIDGGDYPSHYIVFRQYHKLAPITCKEKI